jgi:hypothetical protein
MSLRVVYSVFVLALLAAPAFSVEHKGTPVEQDACRRDVVRLCKGVTPEDGPILDCLKTYRVKLSTGCRTVLESHGQ